MPTTEHFFVSTKDNSVNITDCPSREFFTGERVGEAKYLIEVFSNYNHYVTAKMVRDMVDTSDMGDKLFKIKVETR